MRRFLSKSAGATFNNETPNFTVNVRKSCVELVCKIDAGMYVIINVVHNHLGGLTLFANWGNYFQKLQNPAVQMPRIDKNCPILAAAMHGEDPDGIQEIEMGEDAGELCHGFAINVECEKDTPLIACISNKVIDTAFTLLNKCLKMYNELYKNPPFPAWKDDLPSLWN